MAPQQRARPKAWRISSCRGYAEIMHDHVRQNTHTRTTIRKAIAFPETNMDEPQTRVGCTASSRPTSHQHVISHDQPPVAPAPSVNDRVRIVDVAVVCTAAAHQREEGRAGQPQAVARPECRPGWSDGAVGGENQHSLEWHRRYCIRLGQSIRAWHYIYTDATWVTAVAAVLSNWHTVLRAIHMASGEPLPIRCTTVWYVCSLLS